MMRDYRRLLPFVRPHRSLMAGTIVSGVVAAVLDGLSVTLLMPFLSTLFGQAPLAPRGAPAGAGRIEAMLRATIGSMIDPADKMGSLERVMVVMIAIIVVKNVFLWFSGQLGARLQEYVTRDLRNAVYAHIRALPLDFFTRTKAGQILSRVLNDTAQTKLLITALITQSLQNSAKVIAYIVFSFFISWRLTIVALFVAPLLMLVLQPLLQSLRRGYRKLSNEYGELTSVVQETVGGIRLVKAFRAEDYEERRFREASDRVVAGMVRVTQIAFLSQPITEVAASLIVLAVLWFGAREVLIGHTLTGAQLITFLVYVSGLLQPIKQLSQVRSTAQSAFASADRLFELFDEPTEPQRDRGRLTTASFARAIEFRDVSFAYEPGEPVLSDVSFTARKGEIVALVGPSGAGKSTLVDLIPRFHEPTSGTILVDGVPASDIALPALRALTGIVSQDTVLFNDTVRSNIAYGADGRYSDAQIEAAARAANAHGFISELPQGYDTPLGERGTRLSGGQRQRLAIARALLVDPPVLILDEATSALDTESERLVQEAIDRLLSGRTVFVIAHRLSTVEHASLILVLERGRVVERGTHADLLALRGTYARLYNMQFRERDLATAPDA
jgi:subfamily B ATP-binding cassette protein MsbA